MTTGEVKRSDRELPVPPQWRPVFQEIVRALSEGDFTLARGIEGVKPLSRDVAEFFADYVEDYGATLTPLPDETWESSIYMYDEGYWEVLVDLFTVEEGRSDLVLFTRVCERGGAYAFEPWSLHVP